MSNGAEQCLIREPTVLYNLYLQVFPQHPDNFMWLTSAVLPEADHKLTGGLWHAGVLCF